MEVGKLVRQIFQACLFPGECVLCGRWVVNPEWSPLCVYCLEDLPTTVSPICHTCGVPVPGSILASTGVCSYCRKGLWDFDLARSWGSYAGNLRSVIQSYKFCGYQRLAWSLSTLLKSCFQKHFPDTHFDSLVPVPSHPNRIRKRGFDHTLLLARTLSERIGIRVDPAIVRVRHTAPQFGLSLERRRRNLRRAFGPRNGAGLAGNNVLIVDDVMTTGSTVQEVASTIRRHFHPNSIGVLTIARAPRVYSL